MSHPFTSLDDRYLRESESVYLTGMQALVRLAMDQVHSDRARGLNTAGFISGYRGSPIGGFDRALWQAEKLLQPLNIKFQPGVNEEIAATSLWGSQQSTLFPGARYQGVFGMWYGKGPGLDRSGDAIRHANQAGTSQYGGVLAVVGDDHSAKSSAFGAQSEYAFMDWMMPVLVPSNVSDIVEYGLFGFALSRFAGSWVGFKLAGVSAESTASVPLVERPAFVLPEIAMPKGGLHIRYPESDRAAYEARVKEFRLPAAIAFARANGIDRTLFGAPGARIGILTAGKAFGDVSQGIADLGIEGADAARYGIHLRKLGMTWPLDARAIVDFAKGLEVLIVIEEKRGFIEDQVKAILYDAGLPSPPRVIGKRDEDGRPLLSDSRDLDSLAVARVLAPRLERNAANPGRLAARLAELEARAERSGAAAILIRTPYFCSGCPHNRSTVLPNDSLAIGGIGCHTLATRMDRSIHTVTHMGGEGASWIGIAPFVDMPHVFQNVGDGTYFHSAQMCIRATVAADVNITFKILYNDAIAMTGGQPLDGTLTVTQLAHQVVAEGVSRVAVVTDEPEKYDGSAGFPAGTTIHHRDDLDQVQSELKEVKGTSILIYDQTCAAEKRRRRKRMEFPDPPKRVFINEAVCEGCGDCGVKSNCLSVHPVETELGTKRQIDQSSCNKDYSCLNGFCPSFVTIEGGKLRRSAAKTPGGETIPEPPSRSLDDPHSILLAGIGGTGIITVGALLGMAAHLEGKACTVNDVTGSAQKGGLVASHIIISLERERMHAERIQAGSASVFIAADLVVGSTPEILDKIGAATLYALINSDPSQTGSFLRSVDAKFPSAAMQAQIEKRLPATTPEFIAASTLAKSLTGDAVGANVMMLGIAWQKGYVPLALKSLEEAIRLNKVAVDANLKAFEWGRRLGAGLASPELATGAASTSDWLLDRLVEHRTALLETYQDRAYADQYRALVREARSAGASAGDEDEHFARAVAEQAYRLLAYKDEYEVARLLTSASFGADIGQRFEGDFKVRYHMAPPLLSRRDPKTGHLQKRSFGPWIKPALAVLAKMMFLRGTPFDPFGLTGERRAERALVAAYCDRIRDIATRLTPATLETAVAIANAPAIIRGYGHVKEANMARYAENETGLLRQFAEAADDKPTQTAYSGEI